MRLVKSYRDKNNNGFVTLYPEEPEDMWHAYNLIRADDKVTGAAVRNVQISTDTGSVISKRVHTTVKISVESIDFDPKVGELHVKGRVCEENNHIPLGSYHTLDLELFRNFTVEKEEWDDVSSGVVIEACASRKTSEVGAIVLQEGLANICLVTEHMTILKQKVEVSIPRKRAGGVSHYQSGIQKFYQLLYDTMLRQFEFEKLKVILLASPGFVADGFRQFVSKEAVRTGNKTILQAREKFVTVHCSSGHIHSLNEVLKSPEVTSKLADTRYAKETKVMEKFFEMITTDEYRAWYGLKEVTKAVEKGAVGTLLVSNSLFRSDDPKERKRYVGMVEEVKKCGAEVMILSSIHESGQRLDSLGGLAAMLTYPLYDLDDDEEEEQAEANGGEPQQ
ncbi:hypothetical protein BJ508DRAFT_410351 [Ascobolus immersus RN42]|uniref:Protein DOM34 homolog n=1 Tax=Ascobolus immersus RN42 TaxID=1160509 RepID=A0A3N4IS71_ASCIM|nr:hypothetical protein BJ508DRAFT_410351 [Ascobolus immersus RN42]